MNRLQDSAAAIAADGSDVFEAEAPLPDARDVGLRALCIVARMHHVAAEPDTLKHQLGLSASADLTRDDLLNAAREIGLRARVVKTSAQRLALAALPALALMRDGRTVVLAQCDGQRVLLLDPSAGGEGQAVRPTILPLDAFAEAWQGELILIASHASLAGELAKFDSSWFIPSLVKYRRLFGEALLASLFLQLFALVSPLFFQAVMDKVLVHRGYTTLDVLIIGLVVITLFESALTVLRAYVFSHTTSRIDVELSSRLFRHLLSLPLAYFQARRVGDSVARVRELENIRQFLTGNALTLVLDVLFSVVFIAVMLVYSVPPTLIVLASLPLYMLLSLGIVPVLRGRLNEKFARGAENQALLVETGTGRGHLNPGHSQPPCAGTPRGRELNAPPYDDHKPHTDAHALAAAGLPGPAGRLRKPGARPLRLSALAHQHPGPEGGLRSCAHGAYWWPKRLAAAQA
ncbi:ABC transporter transmembrane domain-containing protein [Aquabacterium sp. OR-4]|uniref:ABC transporter transmembrane domain-containing protein n=1 Tax=Aquabacterium sp. OR-4 TaxID=2978127 RepID=UPI0028C76BF1|nr:ABC transporter transmembrane domain-containing protein [Aquabacterium sp. OR-4]MDT7834851.1 ABC transporter transmembrane domain-containing protein [Aquabacterium sp. OR-4]